LASEQKAHRALLPLPLELRERTPFEIATESAIEVTAQDRTSAHREFSVRAHRQARPLLLDTSLLQQWAAWL